jgi:hypothetical protein
VHQADFFDLRQINKIFTAESSCYTPSMFYGILLLIHEKLKPVYAVIPGIVFVIIELIANKLRKYHECGKTHCEVSDNN